MIILNVKSALFYYVATRDSSSRKPRFYLELIHNIHCGSTKVTSQNGFLDGLKNLKEAVKYDEKAFTKGLTIFTGTFLCCPSIG